MNSEFYARFERFLDKITSVREVDLDNIEVYVAELCEYFGICKIIAGFYKTPRAEAMGEGKVIVCVDTGDEAIPCYSKRIVTEAMSVTKVTVYRSADIPEWDEKTAHYVDIFTKIMALSVSRSSLIQLAKRRTFYDDDGYLNLNSFMKYLDDNGPKGLLRGHAAVRFNLKHYSLVNQQIGRERGNAVMRGYIGGLEAIVGDNGIVARMGGDNFVMLLPVEKLDECISHISGAAIPYNDLGDRIMVNATAGVLVMGDDFEYESPGSVLDRVIPAAQAAKNGGKEDILFFDTKMAALRVRKSRIQRLFPQALKNCEFLTYYQPKVDIRTGRLIGAEALCRWLHEGELISPGEFIPTFEQSLDICKLDRYMLEQVCKDIRKWLDEGIDVVRISVNLSRKNMMDIDLVDDLVGIIDKYEVPHHYIEIELTETTTDVEFRDLKRVVNGLQKAGISTAVDDFGIGFSSLNLISEIPWNVIKIDRSLIPVEGESKKSPRSVMFAHVVKMAKEMGLECISEGVETQEQINTMRENGCDLVQGFFFDKPLPKAEFFARLTAGGYDIGVSKNA